MSIPTKHAASVRIEELTLNITLPGGGEVFDTVTAADFLVWVDFTRDPGYPPILTGPMEDADPGAPDEFHITRITALAPIEFMGSYSTATDPSDLSEYVALRIPLDHDIKTLFNEQQSQAIEDELMVRFQNGEFND
jgi:hypothetical protein